MHCKFWNYFCHFDPKFVCHLVFIRTCRAAGTGKVDSLIQRAMEKYSVPTIRMPKNTNAVRVHQLMAAQERDTLCRVAQHLAHECVTAQQAVAHLVEMLCNICCFICFCASTVSATVFKTDRVRREHNHLLSG